MRTIAVGIHDWSVHAAGLAGLVDVFAPVAILRQHRVHARSRAAAVLGVERGQRRRDAEVASPGLLVLEHDPDRDAGHFEHVIAAVEDLVAGVQVIRPGLVVAAAKGPAGWHGGEELAGEAIVEHLATNCGVEAMVGIADGTWASSIAAAQGKIVPPGDTPQFLDGLSVGLLGRPDLTELLQQLGIHTLGQLAALPAAAVANRFGMDGLIAHRLASGRDDQPVAPRVQPADLAVEEEYEDPLERVDMAAFAARVLAERLHERLAGKSLACTRVGIEAVTGAGEQLERTWRHEGLLSAADLADRVRWQLDGWLTARAITGSGPTAGIVRLRLIPDGVIAHRGLQPGLWGSDDEGRDRAHRAAVRLQGLFGPDAVVTAVLSGGRSPADRARHVPWGDERTPDQPPDLPWPGRLDGRPPTLIPAAPIRVQLLDHNGAAITVDGRVKVSAAPAVLVWDGKRHQVVGWAGVWPADEHWSDQSKAVRMVRCQVALNDDRAVLMQLRDGVWHVEAIYG